MYHQAQLNSEQQFQMDHSSLQQMKNNNVQVGEPIQLAPTNQLSSFPINQQLLQQLHNQLQFQLLNQNQGMPYFGTSFLGQQGVYQQQAPLLSPYNPSNSDPVSSTVIHQPLVTSTPGLSTENQQMAHVYKRQFDDVSKSFDTSIGNLPAEQHRPQRVVPRNATPKKMKTVTVLNADQHAFSGKHPTPSASARQLSEVSAAACKFATTRYPFAPFHIVFKSSVKDKLAIDELVKHAKEQDMELEIAAYRHKFSDKDYSLLVFVDNIESFCFLAKDENWPVRLSQESFKIKKPSTPPQLCAIISNVSLNLDWDEFVNDMKTQYPEVVNVIRLKNRNQQFIRTVKIEFGGVSARDDVIQRKEMSIDYMKYKVVEFLAPAQVLICGNCCEIGHFQKNCPLKDMTVCKTCGAQCTNIKIHECSGEPKCVRCGEEHKSTDSKCRLVRNYRAALTRNLLQQPVYNPNGFVNNNQAEVEFPLAFAKNNQPTTTTRTNYSTEINFDSLISKKLDFFLEEIKGEIKKTHETIGEIRNEMHTHLIHSNMKIESVEKQVISIENNFQEFTRTINNKIEIIFRLLIQNVTLSSEDKDLLSSLSNKRKPIPKSSKSNK